MSLARPAASSQVIEPQIPSKASEQTRRTGISYAIAAYLIWGLFPLYWKQLEGIPALQLIGHRIVWSFALLANVVALTGQPRQLLRALDARAIRIYIAAAVLISINWFAYVWAVTNGMIVEASLGYYINPLFSVLLGLIFFREHLRRRQWIPIGLATAGVLYLTATLGSFPWLAILLALTFGLYGAVKKAAPLGALFGLTTETGLLFVPALAYLVFCDTHGTGAFLHASLAQDILMAGAGIVTAVPLLLFAGAAMRVPLNTIGILQYMTPTAQFLLGVLLYREPFPISRFIGFGIVWLALVLFWLEGEYERRSRRSQLASLSAHSES
ncbi:MAG TPA: EamA family transporter RarD [Anaerolineales bacterium]